MENRNTQIKWSEKLAYGLGGMTLALAVGMNQYFIMYLTNVAFLDIAVISTILAVSRIFDGISDILIGNLIDNTNTVHGKARIWIRRMCLPAGLTMILMFYVPSSWPEGLKYVYVFLIYNLFTTVFTSFTNIAHHSLLPLMTDDQREYRQIVSITGVLQKIGDMLASAYIVKLLMVFTSKPGNPLTQKAFTCVITILAIIFIACFVIEYVFTSERIHDNNRKTGEAPGSVKTGVFSELRFLFSDKNWIIFFFAVFLGMLGQGIASPAMSYYTLYVLNDLGAMTWINLVLGITGISASVVMIITGHKFGTRAILVAGSILQIAGRTGLGIVGNGNQSILIVLFILIGTGGGLLPIAVQALSTQMIHYSKKKKGKLVPGVGSAVNNTALKLAMGLGTVVFGLLMSAGGFNAALDAQGIAQSASVLTAIKMGFCWLPVPIFIVQILLVVFFLDIE